MASYYLPKDTAEVTNRKVNQNNFENFNQILNNFPSFDYENRKLKAKLSFDNWKFTSDDLRNSAYIYKRQTEQELEYKPFCMRPNWRLIVGLGNESVYETSMTLHHIYGFPYIPGQAVKGVVRNYIINEYFSEIIERINKEEKDSKKRLNKIENEIEKDDGFKLIFGTQKQQGNIHFLDALPVEKPIIEKDVMNPHYGEYYSDNSNNVPPADYLSPKPIFFLTVGKSLFGFNFGIKNNFKISDKEEFSSSVFAKKPGRDEILNFIKKSAVEAFQMSGIGAKTSVGYGDFQKEEELPSAFKKLLNEFVSKEEKEKLEFQDFIKSLEKGHKIEDAFSKIEDDLYRHEWKQKVRKVILMLVLEEKKYPVLSELDKHDLLQSVIDRNDFYCKEIDHFNEKYDSIMKDFGSKKQKEDWKKIFKPIQKEKLSSKDYDDIKKSYKTLKENPSLYSREDIEKFSKSIIKFTKSRKAKRLKKNKIKELQEISNKILEI